MHASTDKAIAFKYVIIFANRNAKRARACTYAHAHKQDALVRQAGGYMLETLPEATEETEKTVINNIAKLLARVSYARCSALCSRLLLLADPFCFVFFGFAAAMTP